MDKCITNEGVNTYQRNKTPVGKTGDCIWTYDPDTKVLNISGSGPLPDFESYLRPDWYKYKTDITKVVIEKGVTSIGAYAFTDLSALKYVGISNTVETIAGSAFQNSKPLYMTIPKNTQLAPKSIGYNTSETDKYTDFIICGYKGSPAETYASENSFTFIPIGDLNNDNTVNSVDAAMLLKYITGRTTLNATQLIAANLTQKTGEDPDLRDVIAILS